MASAIQELAMLSRLAEIISMGGDSKETHTAVLKNVVDIVQGNFGFIYLVDKRARTISLSSQYFPDANPLPESAFKAALEENSNWPVQRAIMSGKGMIIDDIREDHALMENFAHSNVVRQSISAICAPFRMANKIIGAICISAPQERMFRREDRLMLEAVGGILGMTLHNASLIEDTRNSKEQLSRALQFLDNIRRRPIRSEGMHKKRSVLLAADPAIFRSWLHLILEQEEDLVVVGETGLGKEAISIARNCRPDLIIMDMTLPDSNGITVTAEIKKRYPEIRVVALTTYEEEEYLVSFREAGGAAHVRRSQADRELIRKIRTLFPAPKTGVDKPTPSRPPSVLSKRELDVLEQTIHGFSSREIGQMLNLSARTVETYRERIMAKLTLNHKSELIAYALRHKLF
jgi:DNA-binding NarL/FixJ family response regulator